jgi:PAS domain-containing protein
MTSSSPHATEASRQLPASDHVVHFYEDDGVLTEAVLAHVSGPLGSDGAAILVATSDHTADFLKRLEAEGHDVEGLRGGGRLVVLNAAETLAKFMRDGWPDPERFEEVIGTCVRETASRVPGGDLAAFGEMVALLCAEGNHAAAVQLERLWNQLAERVSFRLCCAYPLHVFAGEGQEKALALVCAAHRHAVPTEEHTQLTSDKARADHLIELQRKSLEVDREHARRVEAEEALHRRERELAELLENVGDGVLDLDPDGRVRGANRAYLLFLNCGAADHLGRDVRTILTPPGLFEDVWVRLVRGNVVRGELVELATSDGLARRAVLQNAVLRMVGRTLHMRWFLQLLPD